MCTRFFLDKNDPKLQAALAAARKSSLIRTFLNKDASMLVTEGEVRPTNLAAVLAPNQQGKQSVFPMKWGYRTEHSMLFNARSETAAVKPTFREDWLRHRCIIPASYYYEWEHLTDSTGKTKTGDKFAIQPAGSTITWLCGLYRIENGLPCFVVLTREPGEELRKIHDRMPVILPENLIAEWIRPDADPNALLRDALTDMVAEKAV